MVDGEISFGRFRLNLAGRELRRDNSRVNLGSRALDILRVLASAEGALVSKDELMAQVWPGTIVEENNLHFQISSLRKVLDAAGKGETWIVTIPRRGYRLLGSPEPPAADKSPVGRSLPVPDEPSLAVLPFLNLSGDSGAGIFGRWDRRRRHHGAVAISLVVRYRAKLVLYL